MNLKTLISRKELCFLSRTRAPSTVPTSQCERSKTVTRRFPARGWVVTQFGASGACRVARRFPARGWVLAEQAWKARGSPFPRPFLQRPLGYGRHRCYCPCGGRVDVTPALGRAVIAGERVPTLRSKSQRTAGRAIHQALAHSMMWHHAVRHREASRRQGQAHENH